MSRALPSTPVTPDLILRAYAAGLFPMAETAADPDLFWVDPERRGVFPLDAIQVSKSLRKTVRADRFAIAFDRDFDAVIKGCAAPGSQRQQTWINTPIRHLFRTLFDRGFVHTVEAWREGELVGGLYGLSINGAFFGESMFHRETDASKVCLVHLAVTLIENGFRLLDTQFITPHLASLGAIEIPRAVYHERLSEALQVRTDFRAPRTSDQAPGAAALSTLERAAHHLLPAGSRPPNSVG